MGNMSREEFFGFARSMLQNPVFREYWYATRPIGRPSSTAPTKPGSDAWSTIFCVQLEEADIDEWWVVGDPPSE